MRVGPDDYYLDGIDHDRYRYDLPEAGPGYADELVKNAGSLPPCAYVELTETQEDCADDE